MSPTPPGQPLPDIKPQSRVAALDRAAFRDVEQTFPIQQVARLVGMAPVFIRKVCGSKSYLTADDVLTLLDQDSYAETFVPRSRIPQCLLRHDFSESNKEPLPDEIFTLRQANAVDYIRQMPHKSVETIVTSTPYWGLRIYKDSHFVSWADGETCPYGHEQTPEGFLRHTTEILAALWDVLEDEGSIWWNLMDSFNTRTQIRSSAVEALHAMQGKDKRSWHDHEARRYSAGHAYLKDGEQCMIPARIAERASRVGFYVKTVITWAKRSNMPEPQGSRVSRNLEYVLHLTKVRTPRFNKEEYRRLPAELGGRNKGFESDKLSDVWNLSTSAGRDGHGAQFPMSLPARCIALSSNLNGVVFDPFVGAGNSGVAALTLGRRFIGVDVSADYLTVAKQRLSAV